MTTGRGARVRATRALGARTRSTGFFYAHRADACFVRSAEGSQDVWKNFPNGTRLGGEGRGFQEFPRLVTDWKKKWEYGVREPGGPGSYSDGT